MPMTGPRWRFIETMIEDAPECKGVYVLWSHGTPLAVGHARGAGDTIKSRLVAHYSHAAAPGMGEITHYSWEICRDPAKREAQVVASLGRAAPASRDETPLPAEAQWAVRESW